jgi:hypothetical protein
MSKWEREGIDTVLPLDWHYAFKMLPGSYTRDEVYAITDRVTPEMVRKTYHIGNPAEIAAKIRTFTEAVRPGMPSPMCRHCSASRMPHGGRRHDRSLQSGQAD